MEVTDLVVPERDPAPIVGTRRDEHRWHVFRIPFEPFPCTARFKPFLTCLRAATLTPAGLPVPGLAGDRRVLPVAHLQILHRDNGAVE